MSRWLQGLIVTNAVHTVQFEGLLCLAVACSSPGGAAGVCVCACVHGRVWMRACLEVVCRRLECGGHWWWLLSCFSFFSWFHFLLGPHSGCFFELSVSSFWLHCPSVGCSLPMVLFGWPMVLFRWLFFGGLWLLLLLLWVFLFVSLFVWQVAQEASFSFWFCVNRRLQVCGVKGVGVGDLPQSSCWSPLSKCSTVLTFYLSALPLFLVVLSLLLWIVL